MSSQGKEIHCQLGRVVALLQKSNYLQLIFYNLDITRAAAVFKFLIFPCIKCICGLNIQESITQLETLTQSRRKYLWWITAFHTSAVQVVFDGKLSIHWQLTAVSDDLMPKIGASQLLYQQILLAYKTPFYDATHRLPNSYRPVASVLTGKLSHTLPFVLLIARCDWKEAAGTGSNQCYRSPCRGRDPSLYRAQGSAHLPGTPGSCCSPQSASRGLPPSGGPLSAKGLLPNNDPRLPDSPEEPFPPSPDSRSGV